MKVFLAVTSFYPDYGGPAYSVSRLASELAASGVEVGLWAPDGSVLHSPLVTERAGIVQLVGTAEEALFVFGRPDLIHDNGLWLPHNHRLARLAASSMIPRVVSTRGMLEPWAMKHKRWKKLLAWWLYQRRDLAEAAALHATARSEADQLHRLGLKSSMSIIPNGVDVGDSSASKVTSGVFTDQADQESDEVYGATERVAPDGRVRTALFLSRIQAKKGLPMLVKAWARVRPVGWRMRVVGPEEDGHLAEVMAAVRAKGLSEQWSFEGPLDAQEKQSAFATAELFILPTHSENFGVVVAEALAAGVPVITTQGAPWQGLREHDCGWWTDVGVDSIAAALKEAFATRPSTLREMGQRGREWVERDFAWPGIAKEMLATYAGILGMGAAAR